jgi:hypothetical protein
VSYRVETAKLNAPPRKPVEGQLVSYQPAVENRLPEDAVANVRIAYPHPEKRDGYAQVIVRFERSGKSAQSGRFAKWWHSAKSRWSSSEESCETWVLDIPHNELAKLVNDLHNNGFFAGYKTAAEGTQVQAKLNDAKVVSKTWRQVPQLDALIYRVRNEGRRISGPPAKIDDAVDPFLVRATPGPTPNSVLAYRQLQPDEGYAFITDRNQVPIKRLPAVQVVRLPPVEGVRQYR